MGLMWAQEATEPCVFSARPFVFSSSSNREKCANFVLTAFCASVCVTIPSVHIACMSVLDSQMLHNPKHASCQFKKVGKKPQQQQQQRLKDFISCAKRLHMCDVRANGLTVFGGSFQNSLFCRMLSLFHPRWSQTGQDIVSFLDILFVLRLTLLSNVKST